jgi:putative PIN family toxin of toxin-antitoxin system
MHGAPLRIVLDTNVILSSFFTSNPDSPNKEILARWQAGDFTLLYSDDIILEYEEKLAEKEIDENAAIDLIALMLILGEDVAIRFFLLKLYPSDPDDIHFLLCAINGRADYLVSGDNHLLELSSFYRSVVTICRPREFVDQTHPQG